MRARRGFSLLEVLISFVVILLVALYTMSSFATGQRHYLRAQELSTATLLAHSQMEQLQVEPLAEIANVTNANVTGSPGYLYSLQTTPFRSPDGLYSDLVTLSLTVRSPLGALATVTTLKGREVNPQGIASDPDDNLIAFWDGTQLRYWSDDLGKVVTNATAPGTTPDGSVAGLPGEGLVWAASSVGGLSKWVESTTSTNTGAWSSYASPNSATRFSSLAGDNSGDGVFVGDSSNRCLWRLLDSPRSWTSLAPSSPPLGSPSGVACDPFGSFVWVADAENQCLRKLVLGTSPYSSTYSQPDTSGLGSWLTVQYKPPATLGMGIPRAIAMDASGWALYVIDSVALYQFVDDPNPANIGQNPGRGPGTWNRVCYLKAGMIDTQPCGLATDAFGSVFWVNCRGEATGSPPAPQLWKMIPGTAFTQIFG